MTSEDRSRVVWGVAAFVCVGLFVLAAKAVIVDKVLCDGPLDEADANETLRQAAFRLRLECATQPGTRTSFQLQEGTVWLVENTGYASIRQAFDAKTGLLTYEHVCGDVVGPVCGGCGGYGPLPAAGAPSALVPLCSKLAEFEALAEATTTSVYPPPGDVGDVNRARVSAATLTMSSSLVGELAKVQATEAVPPGHWIGPDPELVCCGIDGREFVWIHWASLGANTYWGGAYDRAGGNLEFSYVDATEWDAGRQRYEGPLRRSAGDLPRPASTDECGSYRRYRRIPFPPCPATPDLQSEMAGEK